MTQHVAAVVVTYNRLDSLKTCITSILSGSVTPHKIVLVDNNSNDGTREWVESHPQFGQVLLYRRLEENLGGAGGFSIGIEDALGLEPDWIWIMDDDAYPAKDCLAKLLEALNVVPDAEECSMVTPSVVHTSSGQLELYHRGILDKYFNQTPLGGYSYTPDSLIPIGYSSFVGPLIRASTVKLAGLPRADFFIWFDDVEFCIRLSRLGKLYLVPGARIEHDDKYDSDITARRKSSIIDLWKDYHGGRNWVRSVFEHGQGIDRWLYIAYRALKDVGKTVFYDDCKAIRIGVIWNMYWHGILGLTGKRMDPIDWKNSLRKRYDKRSGT